MVAGWADFPGCPCASDVVQRLGYSRGGTALILDRPLSGRTYPKLARIVRALCAVAGRCRLPLVAAVAVTVAVNSAQAVRKQGGPHLPSAVQTCEDARR